MQYYQQQKIGHKCACWKNQSLQLITKLDIDYFYIKLYFAFATWVLNLIYKPLLTEAKLATMNKHNTFIYLRETKNRFYKVWVE